MEVNIETLALFWFDTINYVFSICTKLKSKTAMLLNVLVKAIEGCKTDKGCASPRS